MMVMIGFNAKSAINGFEYLYRFIKIVNKDLANIVILKNSLNKMKIYVIDVPDVVARNLNAKKISKKR